MSRTRFVGRGHRGPGTLKAPQPEALPDVEVARRELGVLEVELAGLSKEKVEEVFWDAVTQARRGGGSPEEIISATSCGRRKEMGMAVRHCRPRASSSIYGPT